MTLAEIRKKYKVPAYRGEHVTVYVPMVGKVDGVIVGARACWIKIKIPDYDICRNYNIEEIKWPEQSKEQRGKHENRF
jgi:hypothetical protein